MHRATHEEAYLGDVPTPLKSLLPQYKTIETEFEHVIQKQFGIEMTKRIKELVKTADLLALKAEKNAFIDTPPEHEHHWAFLDELYDIKLHPKYWCEDSKRQFMDAFSYYQKVLNL